MSARLTQITLFARTVGDGIDGTTWCDFKVRNDVRNLLIATGSQKGANPTAEYDGVRKTADFLNNQVTKAVLQGPWNIWTISIRGPENDHDKWDLDVIFECKFDDGSVIPIHPHVWDPNPLTLGIYGGYPNVRDWYDSLPATPEELEEAHEALYADLREQFNA